METDIELVLDAHATLGEGPSWFAAQRKLYWVDILGHTVHIFDPHTGSDRVIDVGQHVSAIVPRASGGAVVLLQHGFYHLDLETEDLSVLAETEVDSPNNRFNDGKCDAQGRFWAGTMDKNELEQTGGLYCLDTDLILRKVVDRITVSNGMAWSPDNRMMYHIDSPTKTVTAYDFDLETGHLSNGRALLHIEHGFPDGMTVDEDGMIWVAHWGGCRVSRWDPKFGSLLEEFTMPVSRVTSCIFGGETLRELYITTASVGESVEGLRAYPHTGGLFRRRTQVSGSKTHAFGG